MLHVYLKKECLFEACKIVKKTCPHQLAVSSHCVTLLENKSAQRGVLAAVRKTCQFG